MLRSQRRAALRRPLDAAANPREQDWLRIGLGLRVYPHRLRDDTLEVRVGQLYRALVPRGLIREAVQRRKEPVTGDVRGARPGSPGV